MSQIKRVLFPFGIFFFFALLLTGAAVAGTGAYYYVTLKSDIAAYERNTQQYLVPLLDACVQMASLDGGSKSGDRMNELFKGYRNSGIVYKAFFVKEDGAIIAHSSAEEAKSLKKNIASDEFTYNIDQIFLPIKKDMKEPLFADYFLIEKQIPFDKEQMKYLKKYINDGLDRNGWILSRKVSYKGKNAGVIAFLVDKEPVYESILTGFKEAVFSVKTAGGAALGFAFLISLIIFMRYQMIYARALRDAAPAGRPAAPFEERDIVLPGDTLQRGDAAAVPLSDATEAFLNAERPPVYVEYEVQNRYIPEQQTMVQDAIPVRKKMH